jgi:hypothetical protein
VGLRVITGGKFVLVTRSTIVTIAYALPAP